MYDASRWRTCRWRRGISRWWGISWWRWLPPPPSQRLHGPPDRVVGIRLAQPVLLGDQSVEQGRRDVSHCRRHHFDRGRGGYSLRKQLRIGLLLLSRRHTRHWALKHFLREHDTQQSHLDRLRYRLSSPEQARIERQE